MDLSIFIFVVLIFSLVLTVDSFITNTITTSLLDPTDEGDEKIKNNIMSDSLLLIGKLNEDVLIELSDLLKNETKENWYFVGYSKETPVGTYFEYNGNYVKLVSCYPDALYKCNSIPEGYKAICQFEFSNNPINMTALDCWSSMLLRTHGEVTITDLRIERVNVAKLREDKINELFDEKDN